LNYLAHFHLSHGDNALLIGALLGDFIKGPLRGERPTGLEHGIMLHRKIDAFTDSYPELRLCHRSFDTQYRRFAGIMTDVAFDHFLSRHWHQFHQQPLSLFSQQVFQVLSSTNELTPEAKIYADNLARHDVFVAYQDWQIVDAALKRIGKRFRRSNPLQGAAAYLHNHYEELEQVFLKFYPELQNHVREQRRLIGILALDNKRIK
jgi:acyl carrier protein phosphodiesterase